MVFFAKYLIINSIVISNPLTPKMHIMDYDSIDYNDYCDFLMDTNKE